MGHYLKPLRRKLGVLTLMVACVLAAGWVRSRLAVDYVVIPYGNGSLESSNGRLIRTTYKQRPESGRVFPRWITLPSKKALDPDNPPEFKWLARFAGFRIGETDLQYQWIIPYWHLTVILTLLSAWLLLSKPRAKKLQTNQPRNDATSQRPDNGIRTQ